MRSALTEAVLEAALALEDFDGRAAQRIMEPVTRGRPPRDAASHPPRPAGALAYVFSRDGRLRLPLTVRRPDLPEHRGQVSLPGGRPAEDEKLWDTATREAHEEIGLQVEGIRRLGRLSSVYIPVTHTRLRVHVAAGPDPVELHACPREVAHIEIVAVEDLVRPELRAVRPMRIDGRDVDVPYFDVNGLFLWGATAMALSELAERIRRVLSWKKWV